MLEWHVISLLIHGFLSVNARLLIAFGTAFYAIIHYYNPPKAEHLWQFYVDFHLCTMTGQTQRAHDVELASYWRQCDVLTSHGRQCGVCSTLCARWGEIFFLVICENGLSLSY